MAYASWNDVIAEIPEVFAIESLDDDGDGVAEMWDTILAQSEADVNSYLEGQYDVPLTGTIPNIVKRATVLFAVAACYGRREGKEMPAATKTKLDGVISTLKAIRDGKTQLTPRRSRATPRGYREQEPSRVHSGRLNS